MKRLDSSVSIMVANEENAEVIEQALKTGAVVLMTSDDTGGGPGMGFEVLLIDGAEEHADEAHRILG